jgi:hypothetical protein
MPIVLRAARWAGLLDFVNRHPQRLRHAGGRARRVAVGRPAPGVAIARALLNDPPILLLDEPTGSMDHTSEEEFKRLLRVCAWQDAAGGHHRTSLLDLVDRIIVIDAGKVVADGPANRSVEACARAASGKPHDGRLTGHHCRGGSWSYPCAAAHGPLFARWIPGGRTSARLGGRCRLGADCSRSRCVRAPAALIGAFLLIFAAVGGVRQVDEVTRGERQGDPVRQVQVVQSVDGGVVEEILVREGQVVEAGQLLLRIDQTRFVSSLRENRVQYLALLAKAAACGR